MRHTRPTPTTTQNALSAIAVVLIIVIAGVLAAFAYHSSLSSPRLIEDALRLEAPATSTIVQRIIGLQRSAPSLTGEAIPQEDAYVSIGDGVLPDGVSVFDDSYPGVANLAPDLLQALRSAESDAEGDGIVFVVNSGWRSPAYQDQLLQEAVAQFGSIEEASRWVATAQTSAHVSGEAVDIGPDAASRWLTAHGSDYGLCQVYDNESWHFELRPQAVKQGCPPTYADPTEDPRMAR